MPKFRNKPVVEIIEAIQYTGDNKKEIIEFTNNRTTTNTGYSYLTVQNQFSSPSIAVGSWVAKRKDDLDFYIFTPTYFAETYEPVTE